jgi:transcriptional regulator with XRE-family HTH domain
MARRGYDPIEREMCRLLGEHFAILRAAHGWSQTEAARRANMSQNSLSKIENGECFPVISTAFRLARAYGVSLASVAALIDEQFGYGEEAA